MILPERTYALEAFLACLMITCGLTLVWAGETFLLPHYNLVRSFVPEGIGGALLAATGLLRLRAIVLNGSYRYSPVWRMGGCCVGAGFWLSLAVAVGAESLLRTRIPPDLGIPLLLPITLTAFIFELLAVIRGAEDAAAKDSFGIREARSKAGARDAGVS